MNYQNPRLRQLLAGEYVLGTLSGGARRRFERLLDTDAPLQEAVFEWHTRFAPLTDALPPVAPPAHVWRRLEQRLPPAAVRSVVVHPVSFWQRVDFWRPLAVAASLALLSMSLYILTLPARAPAAGYIAVLTDTQAHPAWVVSLASASGRINVKVINIPSPPAGKAFELWAIPPDGHPRALGMLPVTGSGVLAVSNPVAHSAGTAQALAVSVEPPGGSPTGAPTGAVLYQGVWLPLEGA